MSGIDLYYFPSSPPVRCVLLLARLLGITLNLKTVNIFNGEQMTEDYLKLNPLHQVPTLVDNGFVLYESRAIMRYLATKYDTEGKYLPKDIQKAAIVDQQMYFDGLILFHYQAKYMVPVIFEKLQPDLIMYAKMQDSLQVYEDMLGRSKFAAGDNMTIADLTFLTTVTTAEATAVDISKYKNINAWVATMKQELHDYGYDEIDGAFCEKIKSLWSSLIK